MREGTVVRFYFRLWKDNSSVLLYARRMTARKQYGAVRLRTGTVLLLPSSIMFTSFFFYILLVFGFFVKGKYLGTEEEKERNFLKNRNFKPYLYCVRLHFLS